MTTNRLSFRAYRAALRDYILGSGEAGLTAAYELGRTGLRTRDGFLHILEFHQEAVAGLLKTAGGTDELRRQLRASAEFLCEALCPFEVALRGYRAMWKRSADQQRRWRRRSSLARI